MRFYADFEGYSLNIYWSEICLELNLSRKTKHVLDCIQYNFALKMYTYIIWSILILFGAAHVHAGSGVKAAPLNNPGINRY
jgi:hypothetical protein